MPICRTVDLSVEERDVGSACGPARTVWLTDPSGLMQFGAGIETLMPGSRSSRAHWHSAEDELVYVMEGELTLIEGGRETRLDCGDAAWFFAGEPVGHCLVNHTASPARYLVVGTRAPFDRVTYPGLDRVCLRDRSLTDDVWLDGRGRPAGRPGE